MEVNNGNNYAIKYTNTCPPTKYRTQFSRCPTMAELSRDQDEYDDRDTSDVNDYWSNGNYISGLDY